MNRIEKLIHNEKNQLRKKQIDFIYMFILSQGYSKQGKAMIFNYFAMVIKEKKDLESFLHNFLTDFFDDKILKTLENFKAIKI